eukprot:SAG11_NODE_2533_length_3246_cov_40.379409_3_plen_249_part_00
MRMPCVLVLCVVVLALCGCEVVEGQFRLTSLTEEQQDAIRGNEISDCLIPIGLSCTKSLSEVCDWENGEDECNPNGYTTFQEIIDNARSTGWCGLTAQDFIHNLNEIDGLCPDSGADGGGGAADEGGDEGGGGAAAGVGSGGPGEDDVPAVTKKPPNNSCPYAHDGECDEPMYCGDGTDCSDCGNCATQEVDDTCRYALDGECDEPRYCALGTDCTDCDYCGGHRRLSEERVALKMDDEATLGMELDT